MELEQYLQAIRNCPDNDVLFKGCDGEESFESKLSIEYGIYDNYSILLNANVEDIAWLLEEELGMKFVKKFTEQRPRIQCKIDSSKKPKEIIRYYTKPNSCYEWEFHHDNGTDLSLRNFLDLAAVTCGGWYTGLFCEDEIKERYPQAPEHFRKQIENFNVTIFLFPDFDQRLQLVNAVQVIDEISSMAMERHIPLCLPASQGLKYFKDFSRIVYYFADN